MREEVIKSFKTFLLILILFLLHFNAFESKENTLKGTKHYHWANIVFSSLTTQPATKTIIKVWQKNKNILFGMILKTFYTCYSVEIFMGHTQKKPYVSYVCVLFLLFWRQFSLRNKDDTRDRSKISRWHEEYKNSSGNAQWSSQYCIVVVPFFLLWNLQRIPVIFRSLF